MRILFGGYPLLFAVAMLASMSLFADAAQGQVGLNIYGLSHHFGDEYASQPKEINPGLGLHWTFDRYRRTSLEINAGMYHDSFSNTNHHLGMGGRVKVWGPLEIGLHAVLSQSASVNRKQPLLYPMPFLSLRYKRFAVNSVYIPEVSGLNRVATLGFSATVFPFGSGFVWDDPGQLPQGRSSALEFSILGLTQLGNFPDMGIAWRRMFNARQGLRLGFNLRGIISINDDYDGGEYSANLLVQYLHRLNDQQRSSGYFAPGIRLKYFNDEYRSHIIYDLLFNFGWDYKLNNKFAIFLETDFSFSFDNSVRADSDSIISKSHHTTLRSNGIILGVTAWL